MTFGGWIFFILTWGIIISLVVFSYGKVIRDSGNEKNPDNPDMTE